MKIKKLLLTLCKKEIKEIVNVAILMEHLLGEDERQKVVKNVSNIIDECDKPNGLYEL